MHRILVLLRTAVFAAVLLSLASPPVASAAALSASFASPAFVWSGATSTYGVSQGDFDGDTDEDLFVSRGADGIAIMRNDGPGGFVLASEFTAASSAATFPKDLDDDGDLDLVVYTADAGGVRVLKGDGAGSFSARDALHNGSYVSYVSCEDFTGDGTPDLLIGLGDSYGSLWSGDGDGTFTYSGQLPGSEPSPTGSCSGDLDDDGDADVVLADFSGGALDVCMNDGSGSFARVRVAAAVLPSQSTKNGLAMADFDRDGYQDIATMSWMGHLVQVFYGDGAGHFPRTSFVSVDDFGLKAISAGDVNRDGIPDIVVAGDTGVWVMMPPSSELRTLLNDGNGAFTTRTPPYAWTWGQSPVSVSVADYSGDGVEDLIVGHLYNTVAGNVTLSQNTLAAPNHVPVSSVDAYAANAGTPLTVEVADSVISNDTDADSETLTAKLRADASHGTVVMAADGSFEYVPDAGFKGVDSFSYQAYDGAVYSLPATVTVDVVAGPRSLRYLAGTGGAIIGQAVQSVDYWDMGSSVEARANTGYRFLSWSDGGVEAIRADRATADSTFTATFAINTYTLGYAAGPHGSISGVSPQTVEYDASGSAVTAVPDAGYHFVAWSDGVSTPTRTDAHVAADMSVTAQFALNSYTLTYTAQPHGWITGTTYQSVSHGGSGSPVQAVAATGYRFLRWSDGSTANPRADSPVTSSVSVSAVFALSNDATLKSLKTSKGSLSKKFASNVTAYKNTIRASTTRAKVTVVPRIAGSKVQMRIGTSGSWSTATSKSVSVKKGKTKTLYIRVTSRDGKVRKTYSVKVYRKSK